MGDLSGIAVKFKAHTSAAIKALREFRRQIALLTPQATRCMICGKVKDPYGNHVRHFWYQKFTAPFVPYNPRCKFCHWPAPAKETENEKA